LCYGLDLEQSTKRGRRSHAEIRTALRRARRRQMADLDGTADAWDDSGEDDGPQDDWDAEPSSESSASLSAVPEPEPEPEQGTRRVKKGKKRFKDLLAEKDEEHASENLDAFTTTSKVARPKHVAEAERAAKAAQKAERIRQAAERAEKARKAAEDEPESWDDQGDGGDQEEELDSWDADDGDGAGGEDSAEPSKPVYDKAKLLSFKDWQPSEEAEDEAVGKLEAIFGPLRAKPQERPSIEEMEKKTRAEDEEKWSRGDKVAADQRGRHGQGGEDRLSWRQKAGPGLVKTDNAWKPGRGKESEDEKTLKKVNGLLNKLTLEKFEPLLERFMELPIDSPELLRETINLIFDKATSEEKFCPMYANLCQQLSHKFSEESVKTMEKFTETEDGKKVTFRRLLLNQCQEEFEKEKKLEVLSKEEMAGLDEDEREQVLLRERRCKVRSLGNIIFIAEMFKEKMLNEVIMHECVVRLLTAPEGSERPDEESIVCLCKLLATVGAHLDHDKAQAYMKKYFKLISKYEQDPQISSRIRFMLRDLVELRASSWTPRTKADGPKTIREVHQDAMEEERAASQRGKGGGGQRGSKRVQQQPGTRGGGSGGGGRNERVRPTVTRADSSASGAVAPPVRKQQAPALDQVNDGPMAELERYLTGSLPAAVAPAGAEEVQRWIYDNVDATSRQGPEFARAAVRSVLRVASAEVTNAAAQPAHVPVPVHVQQRWRRSLGALCPFLAWCTRSQGRALQLAALHEAESMCTSSAWADTRAVFTCLYENDVAEPEVFLDWRDQANAGGKKMNGGGDLLSGWMENLAASLESNPLVGCDGEDEYIVNG
jgi:hypothetical protein